MNGWVGNDCHGMISIQLNSRIANISIPVAGDLFKGCTKLQSFTMNTGLNLRGLGGANYSGDTNGSSITLLTSSCSALTTVDLSSSALQGGNGGVGSGGLTRAC